MRPPVDFPATSETDLPQEDRGIRTHDGFYLRMGAGAGAMIGTWKGGESNPGKISISAFAAALEVACGYAIFRGLVIGGGIFGGIASVSGGTFSDGASSIADAMVFGPFIDFYPDPKGGLHFQLAVGGAGWDATNLTERTGSTVTCNSTLNPDGTYTTHCTQPTTSADYTGVGFGVSAGVGYEMWAGEQWSLGALLRFNYMMGQMTPKNSKMGDKVNASAVLPAVLLSVTYN